MRAARRYGLLLCLLALPALAQEREADHEALRAILQQGAQALNTRNFDAIPPLLHPQFTIITVDNRKFTTLDAFKAYWNGLFEGEDPVLERIEARPVADALTEFVGDDVGVAHGTSDDVYHFLDGDVRSMPTRWTAVVARDAGVWKLVKLHFSANVLDNPVLDATRDGALRITAAVGAGLLVVGLVAGFLFGRRRRLA